ncbi:MAG: histone deacetylase [Cyclobacteriaceae bacterium]
MEKYDLLRSQLLYEGTIEEENLFCPDTIKDIDVLRVHDPEYYRQLNELTLSKKAIRKTGFPLSAELVAREKVIMQGTLMCTQYALEHGVSMNIAGGTHHSYTAHGEGFCLLNDIAISAAYLTEKNPSMNILVVDLDVHQGNGTAEIFRSNRKVFTFSMHGEKNYPMKKEQSDLDIGLPDGTGDEVYLSRLTESLDRIFGKFEPNFVFYQSGVDVLASDKLGRLSMTSEGCYKRDEIVLKTCKERDLPVVASMGGGYSEDVGVIVEAHANTFRLANDLYF